MQHFFSLIVFFITLSLFLSSCTKRQAKPKIYNHQPLYVPSSNLINKNYPQQNYNLNQNYPIANYQAQTNYPKQNYNLNQNYPRANYQAQTNYPQQNYNLNQNYPRANYQNQNSTYHNKKALSPLQNNIQMSSNDSNIIFNREEFLKLINEVRAKGAYCSPPAPPVVWGNHLEQAAASHSKDMAMNNFLGHNGSGTYYDPAKKAPGIGSNFRERILFFGYPTKPYDLVGENATITKDFKNYNFPIKEHFRRSLALYISDPPHCKILMNPRFKSVGIGIYKKGLNYYWTMDLGQSYN